MPKFISDPLCSSRRSISRSTQQQQDTIGTLVSATRISIRENTRRVIALRLLVVATVLLIVLAHARPPTVDANPLSIRAYTLKAPGSSRWHVKKCKVTQTAAIHKILDNVCLHCHELFNHKYPNMRADCSANCYKSETFKKCLALFSGNGMVKSIKHFLLHHNDDEAIEY